MKNGINGISEHGAFHGTRNGLTDDITAHHGDDGDKRADAGQGILCQATR